MTAPTKIIDLNLPTVALVGRVNVGKSTLFNRLTDSARALVSTIPGTTRTRNIGLATWRGKQFRLVDTGGLTFSAEVPLEDAIIKQTELAIKEASLIVFLTDTQAGILPQEKELAKILRKKRPQKTIILAANKADSPKWRGVAHESDWLKLGLGEPLPMSAQNGSGVGDLLELIFKHLNKAATRPKQIALDAAVKIAIVGKPNVGKSSLFNKLIGEERVIVSPMPHTTREPHDTLVEFEGRKLLFVDTAGIRRKTKVAGELERAGIGKSLEVIRQSDIVLLLLDAGEPITDQDQQLAGLLREHIKSAIIVVNKWDLAEANDDAFRNDVKKRIYASFPHLDYAPIVLVSAESGYRVHQILPLIMRADQERKIQIADDELKSFLTSIVKKHLPARGKGVRHPKILGLRQVHHSPPIFEMLIKAKTSVHFSYVHYVINRLREKYSFFACPVIIKLSKMKQQKI